MNKIGTGKQRKLRIKPGGILLGFKHFILCCFFPAFSLSLQPFEHPLCTKDGVIFDLL